MWVWVGAASAADTVDSSALVGMGRTGFAAARENAALTLNPGLLALHERYDFQGQFRYGPDGATMWGASAVDGRTSPKLSGGLQYSGDVSEPPLTVQDLPGWRIPGEDIPNRKRHHDVAVALGVPFADRRASLGIAANVGHYANDRLGSGWIGDGYVGFGARPVDPLTLGVALRNFVPLPVEDRPTELGGGLRVEEGGVALAADAVWVPAASDPLPVAFAAGAEARLSALGLRAGWRRDAWTGDHAATAGLGFVGPGASLDYAVVVPLTSDLALETTTHQISLRFAAPEPIPEP